MSGPKINADSADSAAKKEESGDKTAEEDAQTDPQLEIYLKDHAKLARILDEHRMLKEAIECSPMLFCLYDKDTNLVTWNAAFESLHPEAFSNHRDKALSGTLKYSDIIRYQAAKSTPAAELEAEVERRVEAHNNPEGFVFERQYESIGWIRGNKYHLPGGGVAGVSLYIDELKKRETELAEA